MNILHRDTTENDLYLMTSEEFVMVPAMYSLGKIFHKNIPNCLQTLAAYVYSFLFFTAFSALSRFSIRKMQFMKFCCFWTTDLIDKVENRFLSSEKENCWVASHSGNYKHLVLLIK